MIGTTVDKIMSHHVMRLGYDPGTRTLQSTPLFSASTGMVGPATGGYAMAGYPRPYRPAASARRISSDMLRAPVFAMRLAR